MSPINIFLSQRSETLWSSNLPSVVMTNLQRWMADRILSTPVLHHGWSHVRIKKNLIIIIANSQPCQRQSNADGYVISLVYHGSLFQRILRNIWELVIQSKPHILWKQSWIWNDSHGTRLKRHIIHRVSFSFFIYTYVKTHSLNHYQDSPLHCMGGLLETWTYCPLVFCFSWLALPKSSWWRTKSW